MMSGVCVCVRFVYLVQLSASKVIKLTQLRLQLVQYWLGERLDSRFNHLGSILAK
jgi:hypothetical protein